MGTTQTDSESDVDVESNQSDSTYSPPEGITGAIRESVLLKLALAGVLFVLVGTFFDSGLVVPAGGLWSIWAAVFAVWGGGLVLVGIAGYSVLYWQRN